jgi:hypothetical protein
MLLREHPLFRYHNIPSWPPVWTWTGGLETDRPRGEIGILRKVELSNVLPADRCFCISNMRDHPISAVSYSMTAPFVVKWRHCYSAMGNGSK